MNAITATTVKKKRKRLQLCEYPIAVSDGVDDCNTFGLETFGVNNFLFIKPVL